MKFVFASDSFKGSLSSVATIDILTKAAKDVFGNVECVGIPVADGGEGTVDAVIGAQNGKKLNVWVHDPLMRRIQASYGCIDDTHAIIEMAEASGLPLLDKSERNPLLTSSFGTGELILDALDKGFLDISIAIGGSATNDGGMGCARALGIKFYDEAKNELRGCGEDLEKISDIDISGLDQRIRDVTITVMCDVTNPLCGPDGATYTFAKQKGADKAVMDRLEHGMCHYRDILIQKFGIDPNSIPGSGAAGGLGTALFVFLGAKRRSGIETVLDLVHFDDLIEGADLIVTGEGRTDSQSCYGKVMCGVGEHGAKKGIPVVGLSGSLGAGAYQIFDHGVESLMTIIDSPMTTETAKKHAEELYYNAAIRMFRFIRIGMISKEQ